MPQQLAYVIVTPYSLYKSRTGGILSRLISRTGLDRCSTKLAELLSEPEKGTERAKTARLEPAAGS